MPGRISTFPSIRGKVADIPGYPTRKLLLGGPETRTLAGAAMVLSLALEGRERREVVRESRASPGAGGGREEAARGAYRAETSSGGEQSRTRVCSRECVVDDGGDERGETGVRRRFSRVGRSMETYGAIAKSR